MFTKISIRLALQFTAFVLLLLVVNGAVFLAADYRVAWRVMDSRLSQEFQRIAVRIPNELSGASLALPPGMRDRIRIIDPKGVILYAGDAFEGITFDFHQPAFDDAVVEGEAFHFITGPVVRDDGSVVAFIQVGNVNDVRIRDFSERAITYLLICLLISSFTFIVALIFARKTLKPVEETMRRLEQFTQDASHELRTPLAVLGSSLDVALKTKKYQEGILSAKEDLRHFSALIERLLELTRLDALGLEKQEIDFSALVLELSEKFSHLAAEKHMTLESEIASKVKVHGDPALLRQVVSNLLSNAIKFNRPTGVVRVHLAKHSLSITDNGIGISRDDLVRIFDRFYQADDSRSRGGFGLGLSLVKRILDLHAWRVKVKSTPGEGSVFTLEWKS